MCTLSNKMDNKNIRLYRKRFIPDELVYLKDDKIIAANEHMIITRWKALKPRPDFSCGVSCYLLDDGIKISRFIDSDGRLLYWYCDIIDWSFSQADNSYIFFDLLIDVIIYPDGRVKVVDIGEVAEALEESKISVEQAKMALLRTDWLLKKIYAGEFGKLSSAIENL